jgi:parallel beta-helix repeat protein
MRILTTAAAILAMTAGAAAATLKVPQQFETIQAAANAANDGDTIKIAPGVYNEAVVVGEKSNIKFLGSKGTIWESRVDGYTNALTIFGDGYVVQGIKFRHCYRGVVLNGSGNTVQKCTFVNTWYEAALSTGDGFTFAKNSVLGCNLGVNSTDGVDVVVDKNTFRRVYGFSIYVNGGSATVTGNTASGFYSEGDVIEVNGASPLISGNRVRNAYGYQISASGDGAEILGNTLGNGYCGIYLAGTSGTIEGNRVLTTYYYGIYVTGGYNAVRDNEAANSYYSSLYASGDFNEISDNFFHDVADDEGIYSSGSGTIIEGNTTANTLNYGIQATGSNITIRGNRIRDVFDSDGIYVSGGSNYTIEDNVISDCLGSGIYVSGSLGPISGNTITNSGTYFYAGIYVYGDQHVIEGNKVSEAGESGIYVSGLGNDLVDCVVTASTINGFRIFGTDNTLEGCAATGCEGQGFLNHGTNTVVTNSTFLKNGLDVANTGTLVGGVTGMTFSTGGEAQAPLYYNND